jgi:hypothetical protein
MNYDCGRRNVEQDGDTTGPPWRARTEWRSGWSRLHLSNRGMLEIIHSSHGHYALVQRHWTLTRINQHRGDQILQGAADALE